MLLLGSFVSFKAPRYLIGALEESKTNQATAMMIYLGAPQTTRRTDPQKWNIAAYQADWLTYMPPQHIIVHAPYIVNLANLANAEFGITFIVQEIARMNLIGAKYLVLHPGATLKQERQAALVFLAQNLQVILNQTENVVIALETMAGKGSEIGATLEELQWLIETVAHPRLGICLDTCHLWDAGYDLKTDFEIHNGQNLLDQLTNLNLLDKVKVIHLNDSKNALGSRKDRHANIGQGHIGLTALKNLVHHPAFAHVAKILETPYAPGVYQREIALLK